MTTPSTDPARWLNGVRPRPIARNQRETASLLTSVPKEQRTALNPQQKIKLKAKCEEPLEEPHFDFLTHDNSSDLTSLQSLYSVRMKVEELRLALTGDDMHGVFTVPSMMCDDPTMTFNQVPAAGCHPLDMFNSIEEVDIELVKNWSEYLTMAGEEYLVENLLWSGVKIKLSLTEGLRAKLMEKTIGWPVMYHTGVVYFKLVMNFIAESTPRSTRSLITKLQELSVRDYDGENIRQVCSTIKGAYEVLLSKTAVPPDFLELVFDVFDRCSVEKFILHIRGIKTNHDQRVKVIDLNYLLTEAENKYQEISEWNGEKTESVFTIDDVCWNCGEPGHYARDCPKPPKEGRGRGRGRGGRGRSRGRGRGRRNNSGGGGKRGNDIDARLQPPQKDGARARKLGNVVEYWCRRCKCWTNHPTNRHNELAMLSSEPIVNRGGTSSVSDNTVGSGSKTSESATSAKSVSDLTDSFAGMLTHFG